MTLRERFLNAVVLHTNNGEELTLHPVVLRHFGVGLNELERIFRELGLTFRRELMTFGGVRQLVSGPDEPVERYRIVPPCRGFGLRVKKGE